MYQCFCFFFFFFCNEKYMNSIFFKKTFLKACLLIFSALLSVSCSHLPETRTGNVIFFHPDGMSLSHWDIGRIITVGPDGFTSWDKINHMAVYKPHLQNNLIASSNAGATVHAYGVKVPHKSFGTNNGKALPHSSLLKEAQKKGLNTGICQSGILTEPGTAAFASSVSNRKDFMEITSQLIASDVKIILGGGEKFLLPRNLKGRFGFGSRTDGRNLIEEAKREGYFVIYTLKELKNIPPSAKKVLGIFAHENTYNDKTEEILRKKGLKVYNDQAPTIAQMTKYALEFLSRDTGKKFFLVVEEEGTDNFSNINNTKGLFEAIKRSLSAISIIQKFVKKHKNSLFIVASDSNAGSPALIDKFKAQNLFQLDRKISNKNENFAPVDREISGYPFASAPNQKGLKMPFAIVWPTKTDTGTGILVKGDGLNGNKIKGALDNTEIYKIMRQTLFGYK